VRIVASPIKLTLAQAAAAVKQGDKFEVPVTIERLYGFDEQVEITLEVPNGVNGLSAQKIDIPKDQTQGKLMLSANNNATPGELALNIRARGRFNNVQVDTLTPLTLKVEQVEAAK
jgi:uncharacterized protein YfaS (alpha-2-macroglobulin family)